MPTIDWYTPTTVLEPYPMPDGVPSATDYEMVPEPLVLEFGPDGTHATGGQQISEPGELDAWEFDLPRGLPVRVTVTSPTTLDSTLAAFDPAGEPIESWRDDVLGPNSHVTFQADTSGIHTLVVGGRGGTTGPYHIQAAAGIPYGDDVNLTPVDDRG